MRLQSALVSASRWRSEGTGPDPDLNLDPDTRPARLVGTVASGIGALGGLKDNCE